MSEREPSCITSDLNWIVHVNGISNKMTTIFGLHKSNYRLYPFCVKPIYFEGLIKPGQEYSSTAWDKHQQFLQEKRIKYGLLDLS